MRCSEKAYNKVIYDTNIILYYCFNHNVKVRGVTVSCRVPEFTNKSLNYTGYFVRKQIAIETIKQVIDEIIQKGVAKIVNEYCDDNLTKDLMRIKRSRDVPHAVKLILHNKTESKIKNLQNKTWFNVVDYDMNPVKFATIKTFFNSLGSTPKMIEHMREKKRRFPWPSEVDMSLLAYSKEKNSPILTNDKDFTNFIVELETGGGMLRNYRVKLKVLVFLGDNF